MTLFSLLRLVHTESKLSAYVCLFLWNTSSFRARTVPRASPRAPREEPSASYKADSLHLSLSKLLTLIGGYNTAYNVAIFQVKDGWIMSTWTLGALARECPARVQHWPAGRRSDQESTEYILCSVFQNFTKKLNVTDLHFTTWQFVIKSGLKLLPWSSSSYKISIWLQAANNCSYS